MCLQSLQAAHVHESAQGKALGLSRESAQGMPLNDLMVRMDGTELPSDGDKLNMTMLQDFMVHEARLKKSSEPKTFTLAFRPASRQIMDENTVPFGVPSYLPLDGGESNAQRFYFMTIERFGSNNHRHSSTVGSSVLSALSSGTSSARSTTSCGTGVVDGLKLAHLLGRGSFGCVYAGKWYGTDVAVKVIDHDVPSLLGSDGAVKEANMAFKLRHPHICATLKYVVKNVGAARSVATFDSSASGCSVKGFGAKQAAADMSCGFSPRYLNEKDKPSSEGSNSGGAAEEACWAVIQADAPIPEEAEAEKAAIEEGHVSEDSLAMKQLCKVKEDGWRDLQSSDSHALLSGSKDIAKDSGGNSVVVEQPKQTWIIIEYCDRGSLQDAIDRGWLRQNVQVLNSPPNLTDVIATSLEIVSALQFMHSQDIVHGDLSAWNVMLTSLVKGNDSRGWVSKVADFGMSRALEAMAISTKTYGTITHMPPETLTQGIVSKAMDVYSFGVLLWQMYTGSRPYAGLRQAVVIDNVCNKKQRLQWPQSTPPAYRRIADACMAYNQHERPTFAELVDLLEGYVPGDPEWQAPAELYF
ncbi:kinase-like domain-containing protein [Dunaliella salina]|uniref:Kinase-like domain-containing protein n=1 Tax=Dunaliella salina TaxID=3046 RepID=A0ABQ7GB20_DUNSA|nr:kinase-like domain-containing protein [Dunaliella salina]|eukprot:KAF5842686.1 kinase-like domain-containing protein [Dunaliella salina]